MVDTFKKLKAPEGKLYIFLDEIQTLPQWEAWLKYQYDLHKGEYKFFITGSNSQMLSVEFASLLSGRIIEKKLYPFSFREILSFKDISCQDPQNRMMNHSKILGVFDSYLKYGGMPETLSVDDIEIKRELLSSYFNAIIYRDIIPRFSIREGILMNELAIYLLGQTSNLVNLKKLADYFHSNRKTIRDFITFMSMAYLFFMVPKFSFSAKTRELSLKKCYSLDTGFSNLLPIRFSPDKGQLLENIVLVELLRRYELVFYGRNDYECDFLVQDNRGEKWAIQVCYELNPTNINRELKGLLAGKKTFNCDKSLLLLFDDSNLQSLNIDNVPVQPVYDWLLHCDD